MMIVLWIRVTITAIVGDWAAAADRSSIKRPLIDCLLSYVRKSVKSAAAERHCRSNEGPPLEAHELLAKLRIANV